jgi:hypothetical protein
MTYPASYSLNQQIRRVLYALKRQYGGRINVYKLAASETDVRTGRKQQTVAVTRIERAIVLPGHTARKAIRGISLISANKTMVMGGTYDSQKRDFIIDRRDVPSLPALTADDWIVYQGRKYQVAEVDAFEFDAAWIVTAKELVGETPAAAIRVGIGESLNLTSAAEAGV